MSIYHNIIRKVGPLTYKVVGVTMPNIMLHHKFRNDIAVFKVKGNTGYCDRSVGNTYSQAEMVILQVHDDLNSKGDIHVTEIASFPVKGYKTEEDIEKPDYAFAKWTNPK